MVSVGLPISVFRPVMKIRVHQCGIHEYDAAYILECGVVYLCLGLN